MNDSPKNDTDPDHDSALPESTGRIVDGEILDPAGKPEHAAIPNAASTPTAMPFPPHRSALPKDLPASQKKSDQADLWLSTIGSCVLLAATITLVYLYHEFFGFHLWSSERPEHWGWLGGIVGFLAVLIRLAVIGIFAFPYTICSVTGIKMSRRVAEKSRNALGIFHWVLLACHVVMLLPLAWLFLMGFGVFFTGG